VLAHKKYYKISTNILLVFVKATYGQLSSISFSKFIFKFKHKAKKSIITSITTTPWGVAKAPFGWLWTTIA
jgi:hypothetical protein